MPERCPWPCKCPRAPINRVVVDEKGVKHLEHIATATSCERIAAPPVSGVPDGKGARLGSAAAR